MLLFQFINQEWDFYVQRFHKMFDHSENTEFHVVVGNHDIGFHPEEVESYYDKNQTKF